VWITDLVIRPTVVLEEDRIGARDPRARRLLGRVVRREARLPLAGVILLQAHELPMELERVAQRDIGVEPTTSRDEHHLTVRCQSEIS
jgi:hypothetical protein